MRPIATNDRSKVAIPHNLQQIVLQGKVPAAGCNLQATSDNKDGQLRGDGPEMQSVQARSTGHWQLIKQLRQQSSCP
eukprot:1811204-Amphidinium_carterae.1